MLEPIETQNLKQLSNIRHGFFTSQGGVSTGIYASLNCGRGSDDKRDAVDENRRRVATHLGATNGDVLTPFQIHSPNVIVAEDLIAFEALPKADAVVSTTPGLAVGVLTADCTPVLFADAERGVVGAAHAGWRGAVSGVLDQTIAKMVNLGASRSRIHAAIGPCIQQASYEVGPEFEANLVAESPANAAFFCIPEHGSRAHFDLPGYIASRLQLLNIASIEGGSHCTRRDESLFFSYRRSRAKGAPDYGRQISAILVT